MGMQVVKEATRESYGKALVEAGKDKRVFVVDADLSTSTKTELFASAYPERFINVGVAEQNLFGVAAGLAYTGKIAFASTFAVFAPKAWDVLRIIAHDRLSVRVAVSHGGLSNGPDGWSHQSVEDVALFRALPNFRVVVPADSVETRAVVMRALEEPGPFYIRLSKYEVPQVLNPGYEFVPGKGAVIRDGSDVAVLATGVMVHRALEAAEAMKDISVAVVDMASVKPLDRGLVLALAERAGALVVAEEGSVIGGLGGAVAELLAGERPTPVEFVGINDRFGKSGRPDELYEIYGLTPRAVEDAVRRAVKRK